MFRLRSNHQVAAHPVLSSKGGLMYHLCDTESVLDHHISGVKEPTAIVLNLS